MTGNKATVKMRTVETMKDGKLNIDYHIMKVIAHHKRVMQTSLFDKAADQESQPE